MSGIISTARSRSHIISDLRFEDPSTPSFRRSESMRNRTAGNLLRPGDGHYVTDDYTVLLIKSDTSNNSTTFTDSSGKGHVISVTGSGMKHDTGVKKIGATSMLVNNPSSGVSNWLSIPHSDDWDFYVGDFTIDFWCYPLSYGYSGYGAVLSFTPITNTSNLIKNIRFNGTTFQMHLEAETNLTMTGDMDEDTWTHFAMTRSGTVLRFFRNGVLDSAFSATPNYISNGTGLFIGCSWQGYTPAHGWYGYIDELRISKGIARWTSDFTVY